LIDYRNRVVAENAAFALLVFGVAVLTRTGIIGLPPIYDELYQTQPAMSLVNQGTYSVLDGAYERAWLFTRLIAFSYELSGNFGMTAARLIPSAIPGALLVVLVAVWTRLAIGAVAGWFVAVLLLLWPNGIEVSQYARFYALHGIVFVSGALLLYGATNEARAVKTGIAMAAAAAGLFLFALHLQPATIIGVIALSIWLAVAVLPRWHARHRWILPAMVVGAVVCGAVLATGLLDEKLRWALTTYRWEPWPPQRDTTFYHRDFRDNYPTLWPLFPFAALLALRSFPRPALFALVFFSASFVLHSFGGLKNIRYLYSQMPFFFVIWGAALQSILPTLWEWARRTADGAAGHVVGPRLRRASAITALALSVVFLIAANAAIERSIQLARGQPDDMLLGKRRWVWPEARELVEPWLQQGAIIVTTEPMLAVRWLGDFDIAYNKPNFSELAYGYGRAVAPFTLDPRTQRPVIGELADLQRVVQCEPVGILVSTAAWLGSDAAVNLTQFAWSSGASVVLERTPNLSLFAWKHTAATGEPAEPDCADVPPGASGAAERLLSGDGVGHAVSASAER
jgi:hypothetical protein